MRPRQRKVDASHDRNHNVLAKCPTSPSICSLAKRTGAIPLTPTTAGIPSRISKVHGGVPNPYSALDEHEFNAHGLSKGDRKRWAIMGNIRGATSKEVEPCRVARSLRSHRTGVVAFPWTIGNATAESLSSGGRRIYRCDALCSWPGSGYSPRLQRADVWIS